MITVKGVQNGIVLRDTIRRGEDVVTSQNGTFPPSDEMSWHAGFYIHCAINVGEVVNSCLHVSYRLILPYIDSLERIRPQ